jgi:hypothetical protein
MRFDLSWACGTVPAPAFPLRFPLMRTGWALGQFHSNPNRFSKKLLLHFVGVVVQVTSSRLLIASHLYLCQSCYPSRSPALQ